MQYLTIVLTSLNQSQYVVELPRVFADYIKNWVQEYMENYGMVSLDILLSKLETVPTNIIPEQYRCSDDPMDYVTYQKKGIEQTDIGTDSIEDYRFSLN